MYFSQYGQDRYLDNEVFNGKENGIFVDVGAHDGILGSNTCFFEKSRGWNGICVEANPVAYAELRRNRSCICVDYAISNFRGKASFLKIEGYGKRLCGLYDKYHKKHIKRIAAEVKQHSSRTELIEVQCLTLNDILAKYELYSIDYCNIDTEGGEIDIIKSIDFNRFSVQVFSVENNYYGKKLRKLMSAKNYRLIRTVGDDEVYEWRV